MRQQFPVSDWKVPSKDGSKISVDLGQSSLLIKTDGIAESNKMIYMKVKIKSEDGKDRITTGSVEISFASKSLRISQICSMVTF